MRGGRRARRWGGRWRRFSVQFVLANRGLIEGYTRRVVGKLTITANRPTLPPGVGVTSTSSKRCRTLVPSLSAFLFSMAACSIASSSESLDDPPRRTSACSLSFCAGVSTISTSPLLKAGKVSGRDRADGVSDVMAEVLGMCGVVVVDVRVCVPKCDVVGVKKFGGMQESRIYIVKVQVPKAVFQGPCVPNE